LLVVAHVRDFRRCSWEPADSFLDPRSLQDWAKKRDAGLQLADNRVDQIDAKIVAYHDAKAIRKTRREKKRQRIAAEPYRSPSLTTKADSKRTSVTSSEHDPDTGTLPKKLEHIPPVSLRPNITAKPQVFYGFGTRKPHNTGLSAHRTGEQRAHKSTKFRNLRHLNNARKAARRELSPGAGNIKLRSLDEWAASATEEANLKLPALPPSTTFSTTTSNHRPVATSPSPKNTEQAAMLTGEAVSKTTGFGSNEFDTTIKGRADFWSVQRTRRTMNNGRFFYFPGEFLTHLAFGKVDIGDVRVRGIPNWAIGPIVNIKIGYMRLEIGNNDVVTPAQWAELCTGRSNQFQPTGMVVAFPDTDGKVTEMEQYLFNNCLAALWYHPVQDLMLVFYSPRSVEWMFLESQGGLPFNNCIRVLTRNKIPPTANLSSSNNPLRDDRTPQRLQNQERPRGIRSNSVLTPIIAKSSDHNLVLEVDSDATCSPSGRRRHSLSAFRTQSSDMPSVETQHTPTGPLADRPFLLATDRPAFIDSDDVIPSYSPEDESAIHLVDVIENDSAPFQFSLKAGQTVGEAFQEAFRISYDQLTAVPPSKTVDASPAKARFFLYFPENAKSEFDYLQTFLRLYTFQTNIVTNHDERGWEAFRNLFKGDYVGVIIVSMISLYLKLVC
jgi:hypothetical protein